MGGTLAMIIGYEAKRIFHNRSGLGNYGRNLLRTLNEFHPEHRYLLYNYKPGPIPFQEVSTEEIQPAQQQKWLATLWRQRLVSSRARADGVHIFHGLSQELPAGLNARKIPSVVSVHDLIFRRYPQHYKRIDRQIYLKKLRHACNTAQRIVAISRQTREDLLHFLDIPPEKVLVVYQGCHPEFWRSQKSIYSRLRQQMQLPERFVLFVGTLERRKNPVLLAQSCLKQQIPLILVGKTTPYWNQFYKSLNSQERQLIRPQVVEQTTELAALYQMADIMAYPSVFEGFGIPVLEALASGTPVITSSQSSLPEVGGPGAWQLPKVDLQHLNEALEALWHQAKRREELVLAGQNYIQQFQDSVLAEQWMKIYLDLVPA